MNFSKKSSLTSAYSQIIPLFFVELLVILLGAISDVNGCEDILFEKYFSIFFFKSKVNFFSTPEEKEIFFLPEILRRDALQSEGKFRLKHFCFERVLERVKKINVKFFKNF